MRWLNNCVMKIGFTDIWPSQAGWKIKFLKFIDFCAGFIVIPFIHKGEKIFDPTKEIRRLLIIRPGGIGDAVFLIPCLEILKHHHPQMHIDILCETRNAEVFFLKKGLCESIYLYNRMSSFISLFKQSYDVIVDTEQWHFLSAIVCTLLKPKMNIGFESRPPRDRLFNKTVVYDQHGYELDNFKRLFAAAFDCPFNVQSIDHTLSLEQKHIKQERNPNILSLCIGASIEARRFTKEQIIKIVRYLLGDGFTVNLLGGGDVIKMGNQIQNEIKNVRLINYVGRTSLKQSALIIRDSHLFIGPDSSLLHLACAVGTPVVAIFGAGQRSKWAPRGDRHTIINMDLPCSPCTNFGYTIPTCHKEYPCIRQINLEEITQAINKNKTFRREFVHEDHIL